MGVAEPTALAQFGFVAFSFAALVACYVMSDFSVATVFDNSHSTMPLIYKFTSVWGNHEGSMLLWVLILSLFGALVAGFGGNIPATLKATVLSVQSWVAAAFYLFILITSNPFQRLADAPFEGRDLNPILQDLGLAIHPPILYVGYVGFSISFSFAIAALIEGRIDAAWARWVRPWTLVAWMCLTLGIAMGSYWAYYTLGWGGWWFWDPVENASFMPWLAGTALLHSAVVMEKREALKIWTILLAILTFSLSLIGTFLVRSGVLTSVHAFASDPMRGVFILAILVLFIGGGLALFAWRAPLLKQGGLFAPVSREGALVFNNLFLTTACATVFVGTLYPLALEALTGEKISVGAPFFDATFGPLFVPLLIAVPFGPLMAWKRGDLKGVTQRLTAAFVLALLGVAAVCAIEGRPVLAAFGIGLAIFVIAGAITDIVERTGLWRAPLGTALRGLNEAGWEPHVLTSLANAVPEQLSQYSSFVPRELLFTSLGYQMVGVGNTPPATRVAKSTFLDAMHQIGVSEPSVPNVVPWDPMMLMIGALRKIGPQATATQVRDYLLSLGSLCGSERWGDCKCACENKSRDLLGHDRSFRRVAPMRAMVATVALTFGEP